MPGAATSNGNSMLKTSSIGTNGMLGMQKKRRVTTSDDSQIEAELLLRVELFSWIRTRYKTLLSDPSNFVQKWNEPRMKN